MWDQLKLKIDKGDFRNKATFLYLRPMLSAQLWSFCIQSFIQKNFVKMAVKSVGENLWFIYLNGSFKLHFKYFLSVVIVIYFPDHNQFFWFWLTEGCKKKRMITFSSRINYFGLVPRTFCHYLLSCKFSWTFSVKTSLFLFCGKRKLMAVKFKISRSITFSLFVFFVWIETLLCKLQRAFQITIKEMKIFILKVHVVYCF